MEWTKDESLRDRALDYALRLQAMRVTGADDADAVAQTAAVFERFLRDGGRRPD